MSRTLLLTVSCCLAGLCPARAAEKPNVVFILADDLGYGDVKCLNPDGKIATPNLDRLAAGGMVFTDAHSGSSVCSPTRYGLLTGRYSWRSRLKNGVLGGLSPRLIEPDRLTVAALLKQHGYHTACVGKWHLGMDWVRKEGKSVSELSIETPDQVWNVDYSRPIQNGPNRVGFDYYFGISASLDMVPYTYIENDRVTKLPTEERTFPLMLGRDRGGLTRKGPAAPGFDAADVLPDLTRKAVEVIGGRAASANKGEPFFLYLPLASPHTPILPTAAWRGKSGLNPYADFVMETDGAVGEVLKALDAHGLADNTLVILTSDNGCSPQAKFDELVPKGHNPNHVFRGHKADVYEGGHRVPFLVRWPAKVKAGTKSDRLVCLTDFMATCADLLGAKLPDDAGEDSVSFLPALLGKEDGPGREAVVHHSMNGSFAVRQGKWKLALCPGSGGWSAPRPGRDDTSKAPLVQLFDLEADVGEKQNRQEKHSEVVERLTKLLEKYAADGRSTPGKPQKNTGEVDVWKAGKQAHQPLPRREPPAAARAEKPNVIFFLIDDLGWTDLGCQGSDLYETPHLDRLAKDGVRFTDAYSACTVCSPTRAALMTGKYPARLHITDWIPGRVVPDARLKIPDWTKYLPREETTVAEALKAAGYVTGLVGKWHLGDEKEGWPDKHGFDVNLGGYERGQPPSYFSPYRIPTLKDGPAGEYLTDREADDAAQFIAANKGRPFFLYLPLYAVHTPLQAKKELVERYRQAIKPGMRHTNPTYAAMVHGVDQAVGRVREALKEHGLAGRTLIVFTSDNGGLSHGRTPSTSNVPLRAGKGSAYEGGVRVPLLVLWPGVTPAGGVCAEPVITADLYPTLLEIAGARGEPGHNAAVDGESLVPLLKGPRAKPRREAIYWHYPHYHAGGATPYGAVRAGDWKLIEFYEDDRVELYNLKDDLGEKKDLAAAMPDKARGLREKLHAWRKAVGAQMPTPNR